MYIPAMCHVPYVHVQCRYRLSSGNGDTSSSEDERYDRREAKIYGSSARKTSETTAKVSTMKGTREFYITAFKSPNLNFTNTS